MPKRETQRRHLATLMVMAVHCGRCLRLAIPACPCKARNADMAQAKARWTAPLHWKAPVNARNVLATRIGNVTCSFHAISKGECKRFQCCEHSSLSCYSCYLTGGRDCFVHLKKAVPCPWDFLCVFWCVLKVSS